MGALQVRGYSVARFLAWSCGAMQQQCISACGAVWHWNAVELVMVTCCDLVMCDWYVSEASFGQDRSQGDRLARVGRTAHRLHHTEGLNPLT